MKVILSNYLEVLAQALKRELFQEEKNPLEKRVVIVPSDEIKQYLLFYFASEKKEKGVNEGVAAGFKMITWNQAIKLIFYDFPLKAELSLNIEEVLKELQDEELVSYLEQGEKERVTALSTQMANLILQYLSLPEEKIQERLNDSDWQSLLWRRLFPIELPWKKERLITGSVYLFHPYSIDFYQFLALKKMETTVFLFSPCAMYWGDLKTTRERKFVLKHQGVKGREALMEYFEQDHPLLANWGRNGRAVSRLLDEEREVHLYKNPPTDTVLSTLQKELLTLTMVDKGMDHSIQIHAATSTLREVEVVWEIIQKLTVEPREIKVFAPDIQPYAAAIELVFKTRGGAFDYAIDGLEVRLNTPLIQGFEALLTLPRLKFSKEAFETLLFSTPFLKKFRFSPEEVAQIESWMEGAVIRYDLVGNHPFTWEEGLKRLLEGLVTEETEDHLVVDFSQSDLLNRWLEVIHLFKTKLNFFENTLSLQEWSTQLKALVEAFFAFVADEDDGGLIQEIGQLKTYNVKGVFPFSSIEPILRSIGSRRVGSVQGELLQAVRFTSLQRGAVTPSKVIILMGMEESSFPRAGLSTSLQRLPIKSRIEEDRYLFLEAVCGAREQFILTYTYLHSEDGKRQRPSTLVEELSRYLGPISSTVHPPSPFDHSYFQEGGFRTSSLLYPVHLNNLKKQDERPLPPLPEIPLSLLMTGALRKLARHPLQFFFENRLGIHFTHPPPQREFLLSSLDFFRLRKASLTLPVDELIWKMEKKRGITCRSFWRDGSPKNCS